MKHSNFKKDAGLTMIELVIALFVLTVAVIGVYSAFSIMVVTTAQMSDRFTASYLAQEGIEVIRNIRDNNWLKDPPVDWTIGLVCENPTAPCSWQADYTTTGAGLTPYNSSNYLNINSKGFYYYDLSDPNKTKFTREITITPVTNADGKTYILKVAVTVFWDEKATLVNLPGKNSITAEDYLYNWY